MIITASNYHRARQVLRAWRKRGVKFVRLFHGNNGAIPNGYGCTPSDSDAPVRDGEQIFAIPPVSELPDSDAKIENTRPVSTAEVLMASAISDFWDDVTVPTTTE
jgi:hypothetical protein